MLRLYPTIPLLMVTGFQSERTGTAFGFALDEDRVLSVLPSYEGSGLYRTSIPLIASFLDSSEATKSVSSVHHGSLSGSNDAGRRRGGHAPCECPEESDALTTVCLQRRYDALGSVLYQSQVIQSNVTSLRKQYENLVHAATGLDQSANYANFVLNIGNSTRQNLVSLTNKQIKVVRDLSDALVRCVSSIWLQEFDLFSMSENEFGRLNELVRNATEAILMWFSRMQSNEESTNLQNMLILRNWAVIQIDSNVKDINRVIGKTYNYLTALERNYGDTYRGGDALQRSLEDGADRQEQKIDTFIRSIESTLAEAKYNIEVELQGRITNDLVKYAGKLVAHLKDLASRKLTHTRDASSKQITQQSGTAASVLFPKVRNESMSMITSAEANLGNYVDSVRTLQAKLNGAIDSVLEERINRIKNETANRRWALDAWVQSNQLTQSDLASFRVDMNRAESDMRSLISKLNTQLELELSDIVSGILNTKSVTNLGAVSAESVERVMQVEAAVHSKTLQVKRAMQNSMDHLGSSSHGAASDSIRTAGDLRKFLASSQGGMSTAADRITKERNMVLGNMLNTVSDNIGMPLSQLGPLKKQAVLSALNQFTDRAKDDIRLFTSKGDEAGTLAASNANSAVRKFLQYLGATTEAVQESKASISKKIVDFANVDSGSTNLLEAYMRRQMSGAFSGLADSEDSARASFAAMLASIPSELDKNVQSSLNQGNQRMFQGLLSSDTQDVGRMRDQLIDITSQHRKGISSSIDSITQADGRVRFLGQQFDAISARRMADQQTMVPRILSGIYSAAADESTEILRAEKKKRHDIDGLQKLSVIAIDRTALGALQKYRSDIDHHEFSGKLLERFVDHTSPGLMKEIAEIEAHRSKVDRFFEESQKEVAEAVRQSRTNTSQVWRTLMTDLTRSLFHQNKSSNELMDSVLSQALLLADSVPGDTNRTIQRIYEAFMNGEDVMKYRLNDISVTALNVSNQDDSSLDQSELKMTNRTYAIFDNLRDLLGNQRSVMTKLAVNAPLAVPFRLGAERFTAQRLLTINARELVGKEANKIQKAMNDEVTWINRTLNELAIQTARAGMRSKLDASSMGNMMSSTNQFLENFFADSNAVVKDYDHELMSQKNRNQISAEMLYDKVVQVKAAAANMMGRIAEQLVQNRRVTTSNSTINPIILTAIVRSQVATLAQLFDIYSRGTGLEGLLRVAIDTSQDAGATVLHVVETRHAALERDMGAALEKLRENEVEVSNKVSDFQALSEDIESQVTDFRRDIDSWTNSTINSLDKSRGVMQALDLSEPNIATLLVSSVSNLAQNIESSLQHSLPKVASKRLNDTMDAYMRNFTLRMVP